VAIECFNVVLKIKPQNKTALYNKSSSVIKSGKIKEGLEILSQLIKLDSSYKTQAKCDIDFVDIKLLNKFKELTG
jgi:tetratricopeptide (TPR) repeat protein